MNLDLPFWVRQRQAKVEEIDSGTYQVTGPNLNPGVVVVRKAENLQWQAAVKADPAGPDIAVTDPIFPNSREAVAAAFELYRTEMIF